MLPLKPVPTLKVIPLVETKQTSAQNSSCVSPRNGVRGNGKYKGATSGPYGIGQMTEEDIKNYKTVGFGSHVPNTDNAMVVHDTPLVLCLGLVHSFDAKQSIFF